MATKDKAPRDTLTSVVWNHDGTAAVTVKGFPALTFNPMKASLLNRAYAAQFGWDNRIKNKTSVTADKATGKVDLAEKHRLAKELIEFYEQGGDAWEMKSAGPREGGTDAGLVLLALIRVWKRDLDAVNVAIGKLATKGGIDRDAQVKILAKSPDVVKVMGEIRAERAAENSKVNAASMLDELDLDEEGEDEEGGDADPESPDDEPPF